MSKYDNLTNEDFDRLLADQVRQLSAEEILVIPGIYEVLSEEFNDAVLTAWEEEQEAEDVEVVETVDGRFMVLVDGIQWAPTGQPRDRSGCGSATFPTQQEAVLAFRREPGYCHAALETSY